MYRSSIIDIAIDRPAGEVFAFLLDASNFGRWAGVPDKPLKYRGGREWEGETPVGYRIIRFSTPNPFGILDHAVYVEGQEPITTPMRVIPNGNGCQLTYTLFQRPGMSEAQHGSATEWVRSDLLTLKTLLEAER